jgi:polygalacturonase
MRLGSLFRLFSLAGLLYTVAAQSQPPICQTVTADQVGSDGLNTATIQAQLDACAGRNAVQSAVVLSAPKGASFTSGALYVPSNVVLWLDAGVILHASTNPADFQRTASSRSQACDSSGSIPACGTLDAKNTGCLALINSCRTAYPGVGGPGTIEGHGWLVCGGRSGY